MKNRILIFIFVLLNLISFQNCSQSSSVFSQEASTNKIQNPSHGNGQPFDGKLFVHVASPCSDGTLVESRIEIKDLNSASLLREDCKTIAPVSLTGQDFQMISSDSDILIYKNKTYVAEKPPILISAFISWNYQLTGTIISSSARLYDIDVFSTSAAEIQTLKLAGHTVICNIPSGAYETGRPDSALFSASDIGRPLFAGSQDRWLDTRSPAVRTLILARIDLAKSKNCDGIDFDSVDAYSSNSGFPLTAATQIDFNKFLANAAHDRGMIAALNNTPGIAQNLAQTFDFLIAENCFASNECNSYQPFSALGKAVLNAEYAAFSSANCSYAKANQISLVFFSSLLDGTRLETCP